MKHLSKTILALCFISLLAEQSKASVRQNSLLRVENRTEQSSTFDQSPSISEFLMKIGVNDCTQPTFLNT